MIFFFGWNSLLYTSIDFCELAALPPTIVFAQSVYILVPVGAVPRINSNAGVFADSIHTIFWEINLISVAEDLTRSQKNYSIDVLTQLVLILGESNLHRSRSLWVTEVPAFACACIAIHRLDIGPNVFSQSREGEVPVLLTVIDNI